MNVSSIPWLALRILRSFVSALSAAWLLASAAPAFAATLGPSLSAQLNGLAGSTNVGTVIVAFNTTNGLNAGHLSILTLARHHRGYLLQNLAWWRPGDRGPGPHPRRQPAVRSIWANDRRYYLNDQTRVLTGVDRVRIDAGSPPQWVPWPTLVSCPARSRRTIRGEQPVKVAVSGQPLTFCRRCRKRRSRMGAVRIPEVVDENGEVPWPGPAAPGGAR